MPHAHRAVDVSMLSDAVLAFGLLLTTASQLRLGNLPIGPGELCLVIWLVLMLLREQGRLGPPLTPALSRLLLFWTLFVFSLSLGFLTELFIGRPYDPHWVVHDAMAYPLLGAVSCLSVVDPGARPRLCRVAWLLITFGTASLAFQAAAGWELVDLPLIQPWFWERFRGWSANPNQLALLCGVLGLMSLHLADTAARLSGRILAIACLILPIYVGRMTKSDTFTFVLVASVPIFIVLKLRSWLLLSQRRLVIHSGFAWIITLGLPLMLVSLVPFAVVAAPDAWNLLKELSKGGGKELQPESELRFSLWTNAIELGVDSAMLGLGPGPHLEIPPSIWQERMETQAQPEHIEHPQRSDAPNFEAHNTFLDLFTQGGLIAVLTFAWIFVVSVFIALKARLAGLGTLICGLGIFGMTGLIVRNPIFWFSVALCLVAERGTRKAAVPD
jgi:O-antigen ligase